VREWVIRGVEATCDVVPVSRRNRSEEVVFARGTPAPTTTASTGVTHGSALMDGLVTMVELEEVEARRGHPSSFGCGSPWRRGS
jgi:hypothetical protein